MNDVHALVGAYALDALSAAERAEVERHLAQCQVCAAEVRELRATAARLGDAGAEAAPARMRERVLAEVTRTRQIRPPHWPVEIGAAVVRRWRRWTAAAVAVCVIALGAGAGTYVWAEQRVRSERARADTIASVLAAPDAQVRTAPAAGGGRVSLVVSRSRDQAVVVLDGLPEPPPGKTYQLWLIQGGDARSAGVLPAGERAGTHVLGGVRQAQEFGLTEEPAGGSARPSLRTVANVSLE